MLHTLKNISKKYIQRTKALTLYIYDYKILLLSIIYISLSFTISKTLRNIPDIQTTGLYTSTSFLLLTLFSLLITHITSRAFSRKGRGYPRRVKISVHFFTPLTILFLATILALTLNLSTERKLLETERLSASFTNQKVALKAYITKEPDMGHRNQQLTIKILGDTPLNRLNILVKTDNYTPYTIGQVCTISGTLVEPENFSEFEYKTYLKNKKIFLIIDNPYIKCSDISKRRTGSFIRNKLVDTKSQIISIIDKNLHEPQSSLLAGILFGEKRIFEKQFDNNIRISGVSHIVAASGYNITILVVIVNKILFFLPKKIKIILGISIIWLFAILSGLSASIIRACIMSTISLLALLLGRSNTIHISLPLATTVFIIINPLIIYDVGFSLSISATLGLIYISPILINIKKKITRKLKFLDDYLIPTMSCTLSTLPLSISTFKTYSIWSITTNMLVLPILEGTMLWGALAIAIQRIHKPLSYFFLSIVNLQLKYFEYVINIIGKIGWGSWNIPDKTSNNISLILTTLVILLVIYLYPVENEKYNHYLKTN